MRAHVSLLYNPLFLLNIFSHMTGVNFALHTVLLRFGVIMAVATCACVFPPPIDEGGTTRNLAPRIVAESLLPDPASQPLQMSTRCSRYDFVARVHDPDPSDAIHWRVFINYYRTADSARLATPIETVFADVADPLASRLLSFSVDPREVASGSARPTQPNMVELFISDRPFLNDETKPVARAVEKDAGTASFIWPIEVTDADLACPSGTFP